MRTNEELIAHLEQSGALRSKKIKQALERFPRERFVPEECRAAAYEDRPLPIAQGQTISQPYTVIFMLERLDAQKRDTVLEIGAGSGWQSALLSSIVGEKGYVWAYEINHAVAMFGTKNITEHHLNNVGYFEGDAYAHWKEHGPYQRIISGAAFDRVPELLLRQLTEGGRLVVPTQHNDIRSIDRIAEDAFEEKRADGFVFVPIVH